MAAIPLLAKKGEDEESSLKRWLTYAFLIVTFFLMCLNVSGAYIGSNGSLFYTGCVAGAELFVALALGALIYTRNNLRFGVGILVFVVGVYITLENGKMAVTHAMSDVFVGTPTELLAQADLAEKRALELDGDAVASKSNDRESLSALREEMAELKVERQLMQSQSEEGIRRAQTALKDLGLYRGPIDGIRENLTEGAMEARGEWARDRMAILQSQIDALTGLDAPAAEVVAPVVGDTPAETKRKDAITLRKQATQVEERTVWMNIMLIGMEGIRSLALWVFLMDGTMSASRLRKKAYENLKLAEINVEIAEVNAKIAALQNPTPTPVAAPPPPAPPPELAPAAIPEPVEAIEPLVAPAQPEEPELTDAQRWGREGGKQAAINREAEKARKAQVFVIGPVSILDAMKVAAE